ncbi:lactonase family protein [bacterium]|nr:lactonase family protein [bacterium]
MPLTAFLVRAAVFMVPGVLAGTAGAAERIVWFGTYTGGPAKSEGIYAARFDDATGALSPAKLAGAASNPSYLALHPRLPVLYAVAEVGTVDGKPGGAVAAFAFDPATGMLSEKGWQSSGGSGPCHLSVHAAGRTVLAANYGGGSTICLGLTADGTLQPVVAAADGQPGGFVQHVFERAGEFGLNKGRQQAPHAHSVDVTADGRFAIVNDLGLDRVIVYALDADKATIAPHGYARVKTAAGPRHFAFHPSGRYGYAVNELDLTVTGFAFDPQTAELREMQTLSTLPGDVTERKGYSCAEIVAHPSGKFLYASNRGHDTIAMYAVDEATGKLTFLGVEPIQGAVPRNFAVDPTGKFLLTGGQNSNTVSVFRIDQATGRLAFTGTTIDVPAPVSIVFGRP